MQNVEEDNNKNKLRISPLTITAPKFKAFFLNSYGISGGSNAITGINIKNIPDNI